MRHFSFSFALRLIVVILLGVVLAKESMMILRTKTEATELAAEVAIKTGTDSRTQSLRSLRQLEASSIVILEKAAVTKSNLAGVISEIESAGKSLGLVVAVSSISAGVSTASSTPAAVRITLETSGSWGANVSMVQLLENLPYKVSVDESRLNLTDKGWRGTDVITITALPQ